jgi:thiamine pyrophosphokinase
MKTPVILANGAFPTHPVALGVLRNAEPLVCCDGAANKLVAFGMNPEVIIGDLDSIAPEYRFRFSRILVEDGDQETNDLTKAVHWCRCRGFSALTILGATGGREDHTIANIALLARYNRDIRADIISDHGIFRVIRETTRFPSFPGQQVSIFSLTPETAITSTGLKFPLKDLPLMELWQGSLNEAVGDSFSIRFEKGVLLVYSLHP